jgi:DNA polymerase-3 subunit gamma/tau
MDVVVDEEDLPTDVFTEEAFLEAWKAIIEITEDKRQMNLASILNMDQPKLDGNSINLTFPNETNKIELERNSFDILNYLRKRLNNYSIGFNITINEVLQSKFAYTPQEKYEKLKEKNPAIDFLRSTFDLDL